MCAMRGTPITANISYFDSKVGEIIRTLEEIDQLDNTIIIVTADHGDMLRERGLWYKMNFFEHSGRVPLIIQGPHISKNVIDSPCSLIDILPTMMDIAALEGTKKPEIGQPIDGRSLLDMAISGVGDQGDAIGEYCAEMTGNPVFMIRRGNFKYLHCEGDLPLLYDIKADPFELTNLANDAAYHDMATAFAGEVEARWNSAMIRTDVIAKQKQRRAVFDAMQNGARTDWDYNPLREAAQEYVRNHMDWTMAAEATRFPPYKR